MGDPEYEQFVALADAVSDVVWGGERGWERTGIPKLVEAFRRHQNQRRKNHQAALSLARTRLQILTGRMRACDAETGNHELSLLEAEQWIAEMEAPIVKIPAISTEEEIG